MPIVILESRASVKLTSTAIQDSLGVQSEMNVTSLVIRIDSIVDREKRRDKGHQGPEGHGLEISPIISASF